jgi:hypothetical protein
MTALWDVTLCSLVGRYKRFGSTIINNALPVRHHILEDTNLYGHCLQKLRFLIASTRSACSAHLIVLDLIVLRISLCNILHSHPVVYLR